MSDTERAHSIMQTPKNACAHLIYHRVCFVADAECDCVYYRFYAGVSFIVVTVEQNFSSNFNDSQAVFPFY